MLYITAFVLHIYFICSLSSINCGDWKTDKHGHFGATMKIGQLNDSNSRFLRHFASLDGREPFQSMFNRINLRRTVGSEDHASVYMTILLKLRENDYNVVHTSFTQDTIAGRKTFRNIIGTFNPGAPRRLVLGCHYDMLETLGGEFTGATDSAIPCTMLLSLADSISRSLKEHPQDTGLTLQLIFFDGEEAFIKWTDTDSIYGARQLASKWEKTRYQFGGVSGNYIDRMDMIVILDLIGHISNEFRIYSNETKDWYMHLVDIENRLLELGHLSPRVVPMFPVIYGPVGIEDDHLPFMQRGVPVLHLIPYPFPPVWHSKDDNAHAMDMGTVQYFNKIFRVFVAEYLQFKY